MHLYAEENYNKNILKTFFFDSIFAEKQITSSNDILRNLGKPITIKIEKIKPYYFEGGYVKIIQSEEYRTGTFKYFLTDENDKNKLLASFVLSTESMKKFTDNFGKSFEEIKEKIGKPIQEESKLLTYYIDFAEIYIERDSLGQITLIYLSYLLE